MGERREEEGIYVGVRNGCTKSGRGEIMDLVVSATCPVVPLQSPQPRRHIAEITTSGKNNFTSLIHSKTGTARSDYLPLLHWRGMCQGSQAGETRFSRIVDSSALR